MLRMSKQYQAGDLVFVKPHVRAVYNLMSPTGIALVLSKRDLFDLGVVSLKLLTTTGQVIDLYDEDVQPFKVN